MAHWRVRVCERPVVSCTRTFWNVAIVERAGLATREFRPVFWLTSRHAQPVIAHVLAALSFLLLRPVRWRRQAVRTFDGGEVWLDWLVAHRDEFALHGDGLFATRARSRHSFQSSRQSLKATARQPRLSQRRARCFM